MNGLAALLTSALFVSAAPSVPPKAVSPSEARALGELVTISVARHGAFDVLSSGDLRRAIQLEAEKQTLGCSEEASCLAEIAGAMGARYVIFGQVATLGSQLVLTLNLFDSESASSSGRVVIMGETLDDVFPRIDERVDALVVSALARHGEVEARVRVLVLDLEAPPPADEPLAAASEPEREPLWPGVWFLASGGAAAVAGALAAAAGAYFGVQAQGSDQRARDAVTQVERKGALDERGTHALVANLLYAGGGALLVAATGVAAGALFVGEE